MFSDVCLTNRAVSNVLPFVGTSDEIVVSTVPVNGGEHFYSGSLINVFIFARMDLLVTHCQELMETFK